ncbi:hypothetical protein WH87_06700 [Devosia epidermidihirudinis]|uniref:PepSY domain-containing protein n=2 Tax=Devosia epidermidihirudinis TaxID=1293439 RepID=A0A0F5QGG8_9HYPH|nr:hypothetical protein WH87_06700 [Devosia epidermidihirudinis]
MKNPMSKLLVPIVLALGLVSAGAANAACLDKAAINQAVASGQIKSLATVLAEAGVDGSATVTNAEVCEQGGLVWKVGVVMQDGTAQNMTLSAQ